MSTDVSVMTEVEQLVRQGRYASVSQFVREAVAEKLDRLLRKRLEEQVATYGHAIDVEEDEDLLASQAFPYARG